MLNYPGVLFQTMLNTVVCQNDLKNVSNHVFKIIILQLLDNHHTAPGTGTYQVAGTWYQEPGTNTWQQVPGAAP